jgi:hypothetical protein
MSKRTKANAFASIGAVASQSLKRGTESCHRDMKSYSAFRRKIEMAIGCFSARNDPDETGRY